MVGTTLNGRFFLADELGRGGMGAVYRANDNVLDRTVAIKILKEVRGEEVARRIRLEARILARLVHEHVVRLYDLNVDHDAYYFVMEEVDGPSFFRRWRVIDVSQRLRILAQVAEALDYAHRQGVVHRDVKPGNVLMTRADVPKLSDFGLSLLVENIHEATGIARGTPTYMSPEQAAGRRIDHRADLYSLGIMLYECVTGQPPFAGPLAAVLTQHISVDPEPPRLKHPSIPASLNALILALLAKQPGHRPGSGREVADRLLALLISERALGDTPSSGRIHPQRASGGAGQTLSTPAPNSLVQGAPTLVDGVAAPTLSGSEAPHAGEKPRSLVGQIIDAVATDPLALTPEERYYCGHYLAYLLGGSRREGFLLRRPLDPLNADRARLMLAMTALSLPEPLAISLGQAAELLDNRPDVRAWLSPPVVMKYLASRATPSRRRAFRDLRIKIQKVSTYAREHMTDEQGLLNPGLMPQKLDDLRRMAPARMEVDDELVARWNIVTDVWRGHAEFRNAVLRYATTQAWQDPVSVDLWPEVVYPLIERTRRQRKFRNRFEAVWDLLARGLRVADAGVRLDRVLERTVPRPVLLQLEDEASRLTDEVYIVAEEPPVERDDAEPVTRTIEISQASFADVRVEAEPDRYLVALADPAPVRLNLGELRALWKEAIATLRGGGKVQSGHRPIAIGPYRLAVVATIRVRNAGQVAIQGMPNKQIELLVPSFTGGGSNDRPVLAAWTYENHSMLITHYDHMSSQQFVLWDAAAGKQVPIRDRAELDQIAFQLGLDLPPDIERVLSKNYQSG